MAGHLTYLLFELVWAIPVLAIQWVVGRRQIWQRRRVLLVTVALSTLYLSCADSVAIAHGIWTLHAGRIVGLRFGNLPVEESLFFLLTNAMVVQSVILLSTWRRRSA
jgi:lycopene cyclase domain-containing protein